MTDVLDVVGLVALVVCGFLIWPPLGVAVVGGGCLWVSWSMTRKQRKAEERAAELERRRRAAL